MQMKRKKISLLGLPDLVLECILERLPSDGLCSMAGVSRSLRERCISDHLWENLLKKKWGVLIGPAFYRKWECYIASLTLLQMQSYLPLGSVMALYVSLETGKFWFPAQVYNRVADNGPDGYSLSYYDAEVCYDFHTNTFTARFHEGRALEKNIEWNRLRKPAIDIPSGLLHVSSCLADLKPGDHIEIQWTLSKEFSYGWWYGVVGHSKSCNGGAACQCYKNDKVVVEFTQYPRRSTWRRAVINRKGHRETGNDTYGFYGGIRKLEDEEEISKWKNLCLTTPCVKILVH